MPAAIDDATRATIVVRTALGETQTEIAEEVGVSRTTVRKYLRKTREAVDTADDPRETLCSIIREEYDWGEKASPDIDGVDYLSM